MSASRPERPVRSRFRDDGRLLVEMLGRVVVRCPRCATVGQVVTDQPYWSSTPRFACGGCALHLAGRGTAWFGPDGRTDPPCEPAFGLELALQAPCRGRTLWAYDHDHLDLIADLVAARLRERRPNRNASLVSRLPGWITSRRHRDDVARAVERIRREVPRPAP